MRHSFGVYVRQEENELPFSDSAGEAMTQKRPLARSFARWGCEGALSKNESTAWVTADHLLITLRFPSSASRHRTFVSGPCGQYSRGDVSSRLS